MFVGFSDLGDYQKSLAVSASKAQPRLSLALKDSNLV